MAMQALKDGAKSGILKYFLLGILVLAGGGLVFTDVGGFFRGGTSSSDVVKIGRENVSINTFDRVARRTLSQLGITPQQAYKLGYLNEILNAEVRRRLLLRAADDENLRLGKDYVVAQTHRILAPAIENGMEPKQALENLLRSQGLAESELTATLVSERTIALYGNAMQSGALAVTPKQAELLYSYNNETRNIRYIEFKHDAYKDINEPTGENLVTLYEASKPFYSIPERRTFSVASINTDTLEKTLSVEDDTLRAEYDDNIDLYKQAASRTFAQALFKTKEDADKALKSIKSSNFDTAAKKAGADVIPSRNFTRESALDELKEPLFDKKKTGILGPFETPLGFSIVNVTKATDENIQSFDDVKEELRTAIVQEQLIDEIYKLIDEIDEFFASGGTLENAKETFDLDIKEFSDLDRLGQTENGKTPVADSFEQDAPTIIEQAFELDEAMSGAAFEISNGTFIVVSANSITPQSFIPFTDVKDDLKKRWVDDQKKLGNRIATLELQKQKTDVPLADIAKEQKKSFKSIKAVKREDDESALAPSARASLFGAKKGEHFVIETKDGIAIAEVTKITKPKKPSNKALAELEEQLQTEMQNELLSVTLGDLSRQYNVKINQRLLDQVYGETQEEAF